MQYLTGKRIYVCSGCKAHVADHEDIESKVKAYGAYVTGLHCVSHLKPGQKTSGFSLPERLIEIWRQQNRDCAPRRDVLKEFWFLAEFHGQARPGFLSQHDVSYPHFASQWFEIRLMGRHGFMLHADWSWMYCRVNVSLGPREERVLITGLHTVADIQCIGCGTVLGWKYVCPPQVL